MLGDDVIRQTVRSFVKLVDAAHHLTGVNRSQTGHDVVNGSYECRVISFRGSIITHVMHVIYGRLCAASARARGEEAQNNSSGKSNFSLSIGEFRLITVGVIQQCRN